MSAAPGNGEEGRERTPPLEGPLAEWLSDALDDAGPFTLRPLGGGNSNETLELISPIARRVLRRPPSSAIAPSAHSMVREHRILAALQSTAVPAPDPLALCSDPEVPGAPLLVMEAVQGVSLTSTLPPGYPHPESAVAQVGEAVIDTLATLHRVPWREVGLEDFGRPEGFLERQVERWRTQFERYQVRELPDFDRVGSWLESARPADSEPAILHGDFHIDNCLMSTQAPVTVAAVIDWEMATIGDPLLDLGLMLAFWGADRPQRMAMPRIQAFSRVAEAPSRRELAERYAERAGRPVARLDWYMALAFWKLAAIVEGAYAQYLSGALRTDYARDLRDGVPALLAEAATFAGLPADA